MKLSEIRNPTLEECDTVIDCYFKYRFNNNKDVLKECIVHRNRTCMNGITRCCYLCDKVTAGSCTINREDSFIRFMKRQRYIDYLK